jgi:hypothetical protein
MENFTLKFGKFKGQQFSSTPDWYQAWLLKQDWFKLESPKKWEVVQVFEKEYAMATGRRAEVHYQNLDFEAARELAVTMTVHQMDDITDYYSARQMR